MSKLLIIMNAMLKDRKTNPYGRQRLICNTVANVPAQILRRYDLFSEGGDVTTCPSFTGNVGPGLKDVRTTPSLPSSR